ncbi:MAG: hypothetical protein DYG91_12055 [Chloroflexi bacterium CFX7]|nr:hypothetical protein [Chloroflexi bacterium CFX7]MCK6565044.1 hypothetical protein [Dehalococcoidia bacterium]RIL01880.1 MAG: hypothetical protein DCC78_09505 [bacterium]
MRSARLVSALAALAFSIALSGCGGGNSTGETDRSGSEVPTAQATQASSTPTPERIPTLANSGPSPSDLLGALLTPGDVATGAAAASLWQGFPEVSAGGYNLDPSVPQDKGEVAWVFVEWAVPGAKDGDPVRGRLRQSLQLFKDESSAIAAQKSHVQADVDNFGAKVVPGSLIGDESVYLQLSDSANKETPYVVTARFRVGKLVGRIETARATEYDRTETLGPMGRALAARMTVALDGTLVAKPLRPQLAELMPPPSAAAGVGPQLAEVLRPPEAFALLSAGGKYFTIRSRLEASGVTELGWRAYGLDADKTQFVTATLFPMSNATAAQSWVGGLKADPAHKSDQVDPGKTGTSSVFVTNGGKLFELQFSKGKVVASVVCRSMVDVANTSARCEGAVRKLAEAWYAALPE